jgi:hypothetical protein
MSTEKHKKAVTDALWVAVTIMVGGAIYLGITAFKTSKNINNSLKPKQPATPTSGNANTASKQTTSSSANSVYSPASTGFPLTLGSTGANVKALQTALNNAGQNIAVDGIFGTRTENALVAVTGQSWVDNQSDIDAINSNASSGAYSAVQNDINPLGNLYAG